MAAAGLQRRHRRTGRSGAAWEQHASFLNKNGYVTLIVDSFGPRRITDGCQTGAEILSRFKWSATRTPPSIIWLRSLSWMSERIGLRRSVAWRQHCAVPVAQKYTNNLRASAGMPTYAAVRRLLSLVLETSWAYTLRLVRSLILIGDKDDWTPASRFVGTSPRTPPTVVELMVYPEHPPLLRFAHARSRSTVEGIVRQRLHTVQAANDDARRDSQRAHAKTSSRRISPWPALMTASAPGPPD